MRIDNGIDRGSQVVFSFNGKPCSAFEGESVACALFAAEARRLRNSPRDAAPRGMFCLMGSCQECLVWIDGKKQLSCQLPVTAGMEVRSLTGDEL